MSRISFSGLSSGIDSNSLVQEVTQFGQRRIEQLQARADEALNKQTLFKEVEARVITLQGAAVQLSRATDGIFDSRTATSSNEGLLQVAAGSGAQAGTHTLRVTDVARNEIVASQGFSSTTEEITQGAFTIQAGGSSATIEINDTNNTFAGLAQAINDADVGVTATIINDGSGSRTQPFRLLLSSDNPGTENSISITNNLATPRPATPEVPSSIGAASVVANPALASNGFQGTIATSGTYTGSDNANFTLDVTDDFGDIFGRTNHNDGAFTFTDGTGARTGQISFDAPGDVDTALTHPDLEGIELTFNYNFNTLRLQADQGAKFAFNATAARPAAAAVTGTRPNFTTATIGPAVEATGNEGTSSITATGVYTGTGNEALTFTVQNDGTVGTDQITLAIVDQNGVSRGTRTIDAGQSGLNQDIDGISASFDAGQTLRTGDSFSIDAFVPTVQAASNAAVQIGSGAGAISVQSPTNQVTTLIPGVTLDVQQADPNQDITVTISNDFDRVTQSISDLVNGFNELMDFIDEQTRFDVETGVAGPLNGNRAVISLQNSVRQTVLSVSTLLPVTLNRLSALGVTVAQGRLQLNSARLNDLLNGRIEGVEFQDLERAFAVGADSTNDSVSFVAASSRTNEGTFDVNITRAAEQAELVATSSFAGSSDSSATRDFGGQDLSVTVDGESINFTLGSGDRTSADVAAALQNEINSRVTSDREVSVAVDASNRLAITSSSFGTSSEVTVTGGSAASGLGFTHAGFESARGSDVAGEFIVGNETEAARGTGQLLIGNSGNENTADLQFEVTLSSSDIQANASEATVTFTRGIASRVAEALDQITDPTTGRLQSINDAFSQQVESFAQDIERQTADLADRQATLLSQFAEMEQAIGRVRADGDLVSTQLQALLSFQQQSRGS